jgi:hypothetical protein
VTGFTDPHLEKANENGGASPAHYRPTVRARAFERGAASDEGVVMAPSDGFTYV